MKQDDGSARLRQQLEDEIRAVLLGSIEGREGELSWIDGDEPLFADGLGLDSMDALCMANAVWRKYRVTIFKGDGSEPVFRESTLNALATMVASRVLQLDGEGRAIPLEA